MQINLEYTDTFGGEANYSWIRRETLEVASDIPDAQVKRLAKTTMGISGARGQWSNLGDTLEFRPRGMHTVLFVTFQEG